MTGPPSRDDIAAAAARIAPRIRRTPVLEVSPALVLKLELLQVSGTFKARGAFNLLLTSAVPPAGVVAASGGNFGLAIAYAARELGHRATVFLPETAPAAKADRLRGLGAEVRPVGARYEQALAASEAYCTATGALFAHAYDQLAVVAGAGTCALEIGEQVPEVDTVLVAVGGGGLIGGVASWFRGDVRVVAVETDATPTLHAALAAGTPVDVEVSGVAASALGATRAGTIGFQAAENWVERSLLVSDDDVVRAQQWLWEEARAASEPGGATALAALLCGAFTAAAGERVVALVCGANVDPATLGASGQCSPT